MNKDILRNVNRWMLSFTHNFFGSLFKFLMKSCFENNRIQNAKTLAINGKLMIYNTT